jgi:hypothetical protein
MSRVRVVFMVDEPLLAQLRELAAIRDRSLSGEARRAIRRHVETKADGAE